MLVSLHLIFTPEKRGLLCAPETLRCLFYLSFVIKKSLSGVISGKGCAILEMNA